MRLGKTTAKWAACLGEFFFLKTCQTHSVNQGERLKRLHLTADVGVQPGDEATEENGWRQSNNAIGQSFKLCQLFRHGPFLC